MTETTPGDLGAGTADVSDVAAHGLVSRAEHIDRTRARSFAGLVVGLLGPRANAAVTGILLTLVVSEKTHADALSIAFAFGANQIVGWVAYPVFGRASDRTRGSVGRRAPYMAAALFVMACCTWAYNRIDSYWGLVGLIALARLAYVVGGLSNIAVLPETFGKSRTLKAAALIGAVGLALSFVIKATVIGTWKQGDPSTWNLPFEMASVVMAVAAVAVLVLVREAPAARQLVDHDRAASKPWHEEVRDILSGPNGMVLTGGVLLFWAGFSATGNLTFVYFQKVLHASAGTQTILGLATGVPAFVVGLPVGFGISRLLTRKQVAVAAPVGGGLLALAQYFVHSVWVTGVLAYCGLALFATFVISLAPMLMKLLPRAGGFGELLGKLWAPFSLFGLVFSFAAAWTVQATGNYRTIWLWPAAGGLLQGLLMCFLWVPKRYGRAHLDGLLERFTDSVYDQTFGRDRPLLEGVVTTEDADGASLFERARVILGDPYADPDVVDGESDGSAGAPDAPDAADR